LIEPLSVVNPHAGSLTFADATVRTRRWLFHYRKADGQPLSFRSQSQRLLAVRAFFKWTARGRHVLHNPASEIELPQSGAQAAAPGADGRRGRDGPGPA
jgi:site-specific recombinase XerD